MFARFFNRQPEAYFDFQAACLVGYIMGHLDYLKEDPTDHSISSRFPLIISLPLLLHVFMNTLNFLNKKYDAFIDGQKLEAKCLVILSGFNYGLSIAAEKIDLNSQISLSPAKSFNNTM